MSTGQAYLHPEPGARKQCRGPRATQRLPSGARTRRGRMGLVFFVGRWRRPPEFWSPDVSHVALHRGDVATARYRFVTAIALREEVGDPITRWLATSWLGEVDALTGDYPSVRASYERVLRKGV